MIIATKNLVYFKIFFEDDNLGIKILLKYIWINELIPVRPHSL